MKTRTFLSIFLGAVFLPVMFADAKDLPAGNTLEVKPAKCTVFFQEAIANGFDELKPYAKMPEANKFAEDVKEECVNRIYNLCRKYLLPQYVPDKKIVMENILLLPSGTNGNKEDLAFIAYRINDVDFMITLTANEIWIFAHDPKSLQDPKSMEEAQRSVEGFMNKHLSKDCISSISKFKTESKDGLYIGKRKTFEFKLNSYYVKGSDFCIQYVRLLSAMPAAIKDNEWFKYLAHLVELDKHTDKEIPASKLGQIAIPRIDKRGSDDKYDWFIDFEIGQAGGDEHCYSPMMIGSTAEDYEILDILPPENPKDNPNAYRVKFKNTKTGEIKTLPVSN